MLTLQKTCWLEEEVLTSTAGQVLNAFAKFGLRDAALFAHLSQVLERFAEKLAKKIIFKIAKVDGSGTKTSTFPVFQCFGNFFRYFAQFGLRDVALFAHLSQVCTPSILHYNHTPL